MYTGYNKNELSPQWDYVVVTAGDDRQKKLYESFLSHRNNYKGCTFLCLSDGGTRIGSGGAFLQALAEISLLEKCSDFSKLRILLVNSGGFNKRCLPNAACGKVFAPYASSEDGTLSLFDAILKSFEGIPAQIKSGMILSTGDIVTGEIGSFDSEKNTLFCLKADENTAQSFGTAFCGEDGAILEYLHKKSPCILRGKMREYGVDCVAADSGAVFLTGEYLNEAFGLISENGSVKNEKLSLFLRSGALLSFYTDFLSLMCEGASIEGYLSEKGESPAQELRPLREKIYEKLGSFKARAVLLDRPFYHYGTAHEYLENVLSGDAAAACGFEPLQKTANGCVFVSSSLHSTCSIGAGTMIRNSLLGKNCRIGSGCIVSDIRIDGITLADRYVLFGLRMRGGGYVAVSYDISLNPKLPCGDTDFWETPAFYEGVSYRDSYDKFINKSPDDTLSLAQCFENLDCSYCFAWSQLVSDLIDSGYTPESFPLMKNVSEYAYERVSRLEGTDIFNPKLESASCSLPLRVNFSGTWTDFYPYCADNGGAVINAAIMPDGLLPVTARVQTLESRVIELRCEDSGKARFFKSFEELECLDEFDEFGLHKAALQLRGFDKSTKLCKGIRLTTCVSAVMPGSGLGASSILLLACLKALDELLGRKSSDSELINDVFLGEQLMKTCGGWQDQCGGICGGFKLVSSESGMPQRVKTEPVNVDNEFISELEQRFILISTAQRHFGRFIGLDVARRYTEGNTSALDALKRLAELNCDVEKSLREGNIDRFAACMNEHRKALNKLSPLVTTPKIDSLVSACLQECESVCICGAGGGGYLQAILKKNADIDALHKAVAHETGKPAQIMRVVFAK